jgi:hypothetical protein
MQFFVQQSRCPELIYRSPESDMASNTSLPMTLMLSDDESSQKQISEGEHG